MGKEITAEWPTLKHSTDKEIVVEFKPNGSYFKDVTKDVASAKEGLRYNQGKPRYDLFEPYAMQELARVFTKGAEKYADNNWLKGMKWSTMIASLKRHLSAFEACEDFDPETTCHHMAQVAWNALGLVSYSKYHPEKDDRRHGYLYKKKVGLDIDEVICDWVNPWCEKFGYNTPKAWNFSYDNHQHFKSFSQEELEDFYLNLPAKISPDDIPFEPHAYITSRSIPVELTQAWLIKNGFPAAPVYSVGFGQSKVSVAIESGIDVFVDDRYDNFVELNENGICTFLLTTPHNERYPNIGYRRIASLKELAEKINV